MSFYAAYRLPEEEIDRFLREDCPYGDLTTALLDIGARPGRILFTTRHQTVACCTEEVARIFERVGCIVTHTTASGTVLPEGHMFVEVRGQAAALHMGWKAALNLLEAASGIATRTHALVREAKAVNPAVEVVATRKIFPGTKAVATKAVYAGGALPHRLGLSESVLVFAQHVAFLDGSFRQRVLNASDNRRRTGSSSSDARLGLHTNGRFFPLLEEVWNEGFMELVIGKFIEPLDSAMEFKVSPKGYQTAKQLVASAADQD